MTNVRKLQIIERNLIKIFVDICNKEHLTYYMSAGTMLGAVRHKGYIPWDDDTDFMMPRKDYDKFIQIADFYLSDKDYVMLETYRGTDEYLHYYSRITDRRVKMQIWCSTEGKSENVWIDIYPLDGMPNGIFSQKIHKLRLLFHRALYVYSQFKEYTHPTDTNRPWYEKIMIWVGFHFPIQNFLSPHKSWNALDKALRKYSCDTSDNWINFMGGYKLKEMFPKTIFGDGKEYEFEGMKLRGVTDYNTYLMGLYGDYMTPPPLTKRSGHCTEIIEMQEGILDEICGEMIWNINRIGGGVSLK